MAGKLRYSINVNLSRYKNEVIKLNDDPNATLFGFTTRLPSISASKKGYPISSFYGYIVDGILTAEIEGRRVVKPNKVAFGSSFNLMTSFL